MNVETQLPKTRDEVEPPSHQFPIGEVLKAMAILGVGFGFAMPLLQSTQALTWNEIMGTLVLQACGGMAGFLFAFGIRYSFRRHTGKVLGLARRDPQQTPLAGKRQYLRLSDLAFISSVEFLAASLFLHYAPYPPLYYLLILIGWWGGFALYRSCWKNNSTIVEICENGITISPNHFVPWQQIEVLPGECPNSIPINYRGLFWTRRGKTDVLFAPPELIDNLRTRHAGDPFFDTSPEP